MKIGDIVVPKPQVPYGYTCRDNNFIGIVRKIKNGTMVIEDIRRKEYWYVYEEHFLEVRPDDSR